MTYPNIDPTIFSIGPLSVRWYGLMYVIGYIQGIFIIKQLVKKGFVSLTKVDIDRLILNLIIGMFIGARTFYVFIYNWDYYSKDFLRIFKVWEGGLSFHGAAVGMCIAIIITARQLRLSPWKLTDTCVIAGAPGIFWGRIGNFINGELWGRVTTSSFGMVFPDPDAGPMPRHPSQLYEALGEGLFVFLVLVTVFTIMKKTHRFFYGVLTFTFVLTYGIVRFCLEYFREPDASLGFFFGHITMGQILCSLMILIGLFGVMMRLKSEPQQV